MYKTPSRPSARPVPRHRSEGMNSPDSSAAREGGRSTLVARAVPPQTSRRASSATRQREPWTARLTVRVRGRTAVRNSPGSEGTYRPRSRECEVHRSGPHTIMGVGVLHAPFGAPRPAVSGWADGGERVRTSDGCGISLYTYRGHPHTMAPSRDAIPTTAVSRVGRSRASGALPPKRLRRLREASRLAAESL